MRIAARRGAACTGGPPQVGYTLTELGGGLATVVAGIRGWAHARVDRIDDARAEYDGRDG